MKKEQFRLFLKFFKYLLPYRKRQVVIFVLSGIGVLLTLVNPYLSKLLVDKGIIDKDLKTFILLGIIGSGIFILNGLTNAFITFLKRGIRAKLLFDLNKKIFTHLHGFTLDFFRDKSTGEHMFQISYDVEKVVDFIANVPEEIVNIFPRLFFILIVIFYLDWQMALFSLIMAPFLYFPIYYFTRQMKKLLEELLYSSQNIFKRLEEVFSHMYVVKAFGKEKNEIRYYLRVLIKNVRIHLRNTRLEIISSFSGGGFERIIIGLITLFGGYQVIRGRITVGTLTAIMIYLTQMVSLQNSLGFLLQRLTFGLVSCQRLDEILEKKSQVLFKEARNKIDLEGLKIRLENVSFGYRSGNYILKNLNCCIEKGWVTIAGPSGCGKTSILNLLLGLYKPWEGDIFIDEYNIKELDPYFLREQIGVALQEPFLWNDTIENNIKYARPQVSSEEVFMIAKLTGIDEFAKDLPDGYKTIIGENACKLSEGQKQRIAIARALIKRPKILILDEAMSSMDSDSEDRIIHEIKQLSTPMVIVVSHRLSTVMASDLVYFLLGPQTMVIDRPQSLILKDKTFYNLFAAQIKKYDLIKDVTLSSIFPNNEHSDT